MLSELRFSLGRSGTTLFGVGAIHDIGPIAAALPATRVLLLSDQGVSASGVAGQVKSILEGAGIDVALFDRIRPNPSTESLDDAASATRRLKSQAIVGVGGGSVLDCAKALSLLLANDVGAHALEFGAQPEHAAIPIIAVPTTAGTGAETNGFGVIEDSHSARKMYIGHASTLPSWVILDPALTIGVPPHATAATGIDTLVHALESISSPRSNPYAEALNLQVIPAISAYLPRAVADGTDIEARSQLLLAAHMAGLAMATTGLGIGHGIGHALSARLGAPHGVALAVLLPHVLRFNLPVRRDRYGRVGSALDGGSPTDAEHAIIRIEALIRDLDMPSGLRDLGLTEPLIPTIAADALADEVTNNTPRRPIQAELEGLLRAAL